MKPGNRTWIGVTALGSIFAAGAAVLVLSQPREAARPANPPAAIQAPASLAREETQSVRSLISEITQPARRTALETIYGAVDFRPLWNDDRAGRTRMEAMREFARALLAQGIDPDFLLSAGNAMTASGSAEQRLRADVALTEAVLRAAQGQRLGFIAARSLEWNVTADEVDVAASLGEAAATHRLDAYFKSLRPSHPQFARLVEAHTKYSAIVAAGGWTRISGDTEVKPTEEQRLAAVKARLAAEDYLAPEAGAAALAEAVKVFQARHGLDPDGRIGRSTLAAMNVSAVEKLRQITANLERWRHMRHDAPAEFVVANIADQSVAVVRNGRETLRLRTVVGSLRHATPIMEAQLTGVTLNPSWEIPSSIIVNEILPKLDEDPGYLEEQGMYVVGGDWSNPRSLRIRQQPGEGNSLGRMKFQMQNQWNIYLHDTPSRALFDKPERFFSHGCVRVQHPGELAAHLTGASVEELEAGIAKGETKTIKLEKPLPVFILYWTVFTDSEGAINFRKDAYRRDARTVEALVNSGLLADPPGVAAVGN